MHQNSKSAARISLIRHLGLAASVATVMGLTACGGGAAGDVTDSVLMPTLITPKSCNNIAGNLDVLQSTLVNQLQPAVRAIPIVGPSAASATTALVLTLDAVDAVANSLTTLASTQSPQQFTEQLTGVGDSILCSGSSLSNSLSLLATAQSIPVQGLAQVQQTLAQVSQQVANGLVGTVPGADLSVLTDRLVVLANQVRDLSTNLPPQFNQPFLKEVLALNATAFNSLALILGDLGALNGNKLATDVTALLIAGANSLQVPFAEQLGLPANVLSPVTNQFSIAAQAIGTGLGAVAGPTLQAVSAVLGGVNSATGSATGAFSDLIGGTLSSVPVVGTVASTARIEEVTQLIGGTTTGTLTLLQALLSTFGGRLPGGN
ncbi:MAG: hypothetical protein Q7J29_11620 [Stagnimonas sp.]|nr:hypothetical protein [Stagnimonas sp.]